MVRRVLMVACAFVALAGCGGADTDTQGGGGGDVREEPGFGMPPGDNDSDFDDGSGWPRWKNPCPGPACDPYRGTHPEWIVDPPPDTEVLPVENERVKNRE